MDMSSHDFPLKVKQINQNAFTWTKIFHEFEYISFFPAKFCFGLPKQSHHENLNKIKNAIQQKFLVP